MNPSFITIVRRFARLGVFSLGVALFATSCTTVVYPDKPESVTKVAPNEGFIAMTFDGLGVDQSGKKSLDPGSSNILAKGLGQNKSLRPVIQPTLHNKDSNVVKHIIPTYQTEPSNEVVMRLPAGDYEITGWQVIHPAPGGSTFFMNRHEIKIPFTVKAGRTTYLGQTKTLTLWGKNILGIPVPAASYVVITDNFSADASKITKKYPSISRKSIQRSNVPDTFLKEIKRVSEIPPGKFSWLF